VDSTLAARKQAITSLRLRAKEDITAAICTLPALQKAFQQATTELQDRIGELERKAPIPCSIPPLLLQLEEEPEPGLRVKGAYMKRFWPALSILLALALAAGYWTGLHWPFNASSSAKPPDFIRSGLK